MKDSAQALDESIKAFSKTGLTEDLKAITVPYKNAVALQKIAEKTAL